MGVRTVSPSCAGVATSGQLVRRPGDRLASVLARWMATRAWYRGAGQAVQGARIVGSIPIRLGPPAVVAAVEVRYRHAESVTYVVPLGHAARAGARRPSRRSRTAPWWRG